MAMVNPLQFPQMFATGGQFGAGMQNPQFGPMNAQGNMMQGGPFFQDQNPWGNPWLGTPGQQIPGLPGPGAGAPPAQGGTPWVPQPIPQPLPEAIPFQGGRKDQPRFTPAPGPAPGPAPAPAPAPAPGPQPVVGGVGGYQGGFGAALPPAPAPAAGGGGMGAGFGAGYGWQFQPEFERFDPSPYAMQYYQPQEIESTSEAIDPMNIVRSQIPGIQQAMQRGFAAAGKRMGATGMTGSAYAGALGQQAALAGQNLGALYWQTMGQHAEREAAREQQRRLTQAQFAHSGQMGDLGRDFDAWRTYEGLRAQGINQGNQLEQWRLQNMPSLLRLAQTMGAGSGAQGQARGGGGGGYFYGGGGAPSGQMEQVDGRPWWMMPGAPSMGIAGGQTPAPPPGFGSLERGRRRRRPAPLPVYQTHS